jgi:hypothetical protein
MLQIFIQPKRAGAVAFILKYYCKTERRNDDAHWIVAGIKKNKFWYRLLYQAVAALTSNVIEMQVLPGLPGNRLRN